MLAVTTLQTLLNRESTMSNLTPQRLLLASLLSLGMTSGTAIGLATLPLPAHAQAAPRAYAPEDLWTLNTADQTRVISLEYREQSNGRQIPNDQLRFYLDQVRQSRWSFSKVKADIAKSLGHTGGGWRPPLPGPGPGPGYQTIRCESDRGQTRACNTPWSSYSRLVRQLSNASCTQGRNWHTSNGRVTVSGGCRGEFGPARVVGPIPGPGPGTGISQLQCESRDGRTQICGSNIIGRATLVRQLSNQRCIENSNYGVRNRSLWVNGGCRGVFQVRTSNGWNGPGQGNYNVTCSSVQGRYTTCAWDARQGHPRLIDQLSRESCREGYSWGYSARTGLWVNHGCRARFGTR
jgi:hypothetical protein